MAAEYQGHDSQINALAFSPDGKTLISGGEFGQIYRWENNKWTGSLPDAGFCARALAFSPQGNQLAGVEIRAIRIWDVASGKKPSVLDVADAMDVTTAIFAPDGRKLLTLDTDRQKLERLPLGRGDRQTRSTTYNSGATPPALRKGAR